jgi:NADPH-dependent 2,4-dienoyl-CoA reductase/sulfur reductase-like enzyme
LLPETQSRPRVLVVGGGLAGMAAALELAVRARVRVIERLPAMGGTWGFEHPRARELAAACQRSDVELTAGLTALRWRDGRLLVAGPGQVAWLPADYLVFAGGTRPSHAAELGVGGSRLAGVFTATVAHHLLEAEIVLGRRFVVAGWGDWAELIVPQLLPLGQVTVVGGTRHDELPWPGVRWWPGYRTVSVHGESRVDRLEVTDGVARHFVRCDCVIFAGEPRPLRNVDGANRQDADQASFIQPTAAGLGPDAVIDYARKAAAAVQLDGPAEDEPR